MTGSAISTVVTVGVTLGGNYASPLTITAAGDVAANEAYNFGIYSLASLASAEVINYGTVARGIDLSGDGTVINAGTISDILISGRGTVINSGTIHYGIDLAGGGTVSNSGLTGEVHLNASGTIFNTGIIAGFSAGYRDAYGLVLAKGGMVSNSGTVMGGSEGFASGGTAIVLESGGTVSNSGAIIGGGGIGGGAGVQAADGGTVINTGIIIGGGAGEKGGNGGGAVDITDGTLINYGTLANYGASQTGGAGVTQFGGTGTNFGLVSGGDGAYGEVGAGNGGAGLVLESAGIFINAGKLVGGNGVYEIQYGAGGVGGTAATVGAGAILINSGVISGGRGGYNRDAGAPNSGAGVYIDGGTVINTGDIGGGYPSPIAGGRGNGEPGYAVRFGSLGGVLTLAADGQLDGAGPIGGFAGQDSIVIDGLSETHFAYLQGLGLEVYGGEGARLLGIEGSFGNADFTLTSEGGNTTIALQGSLSVMPCFAAGTRILTPRGQIAVEHLAVGDHVVSFAGEDRPITWIGRRMLDLRRHVQPDSVRPIIIEPDALGDGVPGRRLVVSPDHALYLDGLLVPAKLLLNGRSIRPDFSARTVIYYHVELASHDILLADGAAAETYLDTGHRGVFDNADQPLLLHPDLMQIRREREGCAPLCLGGARLDELRARLAARLTEPGPCPAAATGRSRAV